MGDNEAEDLMVVLSEDDLAHGRTGQSMRRYRENAAAILAAGFRRSHAEDQGSAARCHLCIGAGGHEGHDGEWVECSCQRQPQSEPSDAQVRAIWDALGASNTVHISYDDLRAALRLAGNMDRA